MQSYCDNVRTDLSPLPGIAAGAEVFNVDFAFDHHRSAIRSSLRLHHAAQQRRGPVGTQHMSLLYVGARALHHVPTGGLNEEVFCEFNRHANQAARILMTTLRTSPMPLVSI